MMTEKSLSVLHMITNPVSVMPDVHYVTKLWKEFS